MTIDCHICKAAAAENVPGRDWPLISCRRCGQYGATESACAVLQRLQFTQREIANASGWIRERWGIQLTRQDVAFLQRLATPDPHTRAMKVLHQLEAHSAQVGSSFSFQLRNEVTMAEWLGASWSVSADEFKYLLCDYLLKLGFVDGNYAANIDHVGDVVITPAGYAELARQRTQVGTSSQIGFCAMWFDARLRVVWDDAIKPAIEAAGYEAKRIDDIDHNNRIDDEIIATIRKSRFIVADFTGNRNGVYFEAGLAAGLNIPVIWSVREARLKKVHFDNRQYNFVTWTLAELPEFRKRLQNRIEATIGRATLS